MKLKLWEMQIIIVVKNESCVLQDKLNSLYVWIGCYLRSMGGQAHKIIINDITVNFLSGMIMLSI